MNRIITLLFLLFTSVLVAQQEDTTQSIFENASVYRNYQEVYLSNLGQAKYHLTSPFKSNNTSFMDLFPDSSNSPTFTDIFYVTGSGRESFVDLNHHQRLGKSLFGTARILKTNSEGIYINNEAQLSDFALSLTYNPAGKRYRFAAKFENYKRIAKLNGGVSDSTFFALLDSSNGNLKATFPNQFNSNPNGNNNELDLKKMDISFKHEFRLGSNLSDSVSYFSLGQELGYHRTARKTTLVNNSDFFEDYLYDSVFTQDSLRLEEVNHRLQLNYTSGASVFSVGLGQNYYEYNSISPFQVHLENLIYANYKIVKDSFSFSSYGEFLVSDGGYESFEWRNKGSFKFGKKSPFDRVVVSANLLTDLPELYFNTFSSNHYSWDIVNQRNTIIQVSGSALNQEKRYGASFDFESQTKAVFFDSLGKPNQYNIAHFSFSLHKEFKLTNWMYLSSKVHIQDMITNAPLDVPNLLMHNSLFFKGRLIRKVLRFKAGFNVLYYTSFTPRDYNPALDEFTIQTNQTVGNYPIIDVFTEFYIKRNFSFFVVVSHINSNVFTGERLNSLNPNWNLSNDFGKNYLAVSQYPIQDRAFKFGMKWRLFD